MDVVCVIIIIAVEEKTTLLLIKKRKENMRKTPIIINLSHFFNSFLLNSAGFQYFKTFSGKYGSININPRRVSEKKKELIIINFFLQTGRNSLYNVISQLLRRFGDNYDNWKGK